MKRNTPTLDALDDYLKATAQEMAPVQPHEWTIPMAMKRLTDGGFTSSHASLSRQHKVDLKAGRITYRLGVVNGKQTKIYSNK